MQLALKALDLPVPPGSIIGMQDFKTSLDSALHAINSGEFAEAERHCRVGIELEPGSAQAWHLCGIACAQQDLLEKAIECFENSVKHKPSVANYHYNLGLAYRKLNRLDEAACCYRATIEKDPDHVEAHNNLATLLEERGESSEAKELFRNILERCPDSSITQYNYGGLLEDCDQPEEAIKHYQLAVDADANFAAAQHALVEALILLDRNEEAVETFRTWMKFHPQDEIANHMKSVVTGEAPPDRCADDYVKATFDEHFARTYETRLSKIGYQGPAIVEEALRCLDSEMADLDVLDAGCGTGLCGPILRPIARKLVGVDLSPDMLDVSRQRNDYDELIESELTSYLQANPSSFDLIVAADTLCYFGELSEVIAALGESLKPGGVFVFTVECWDTKESSSSFDLQANGRYRHSESYVRQVVIDEELEQSRLVHEVVRSQRGQAVDALVVTATRRA